MRVSQQLDSTPGILQRLNKARRRLFRPGDFALLIITIILLLFPALALSAAEWPIDMSVVVPITIASVVIGFLLARSQYNELFALMMSFLYAFATMFVLAAMSIEDGGIGVFNRTIQWIADIFTGGINQDTLVFTLLIGLLFWFLGYNASWHVFRIDRIWRAVLPPGIILASNVVFYAGEDSLDVYLFAYIFFALLLVINSNLDAREWEWYSNGVRVPTRMRSQFMRYGAVLALLIVIFGWLIPTNGLQQQLNSFQEFMRSDPLMEFSEFWNRMFASIDSEGPASADYYGSDSLQLGGAIELGDQEILRISVNNDRRYYWRSRVFDTYELGEWSAGASIRLTTPGSPLQIPLEPTLGRETIIQNFTVLNRSSRLVYAAPQMQSVNLPTRTYMSYINPQDEANSPYNVSAVRPMNVLTQGETYTAVSQMSVASADELRQAGTNYPDWILQHPQYLRTSPNVISDRTAELARNIVAQTGADNPYDIAKSIEIWLRRNITYNEKIPPPPAGQDSIEWFLFDIREGYCNYYATAMITMLRSQGIPARMAAGFSQGEWDSTTGTFLVRERDAHTWVEAYFPGYGWVEFEPTAAQAPLTRDGDSRFTEQSFTEEQALPTSTPTATPTPIPPTPTPMPSATGDNAAQQNENQATEPPPTATITPTFTPSPTPTPVILPTQPAPVAPEPTDPLSFILPALGFLLVLIVFVMAILGIVLFTYWWWEWRGMKGLSPISRAYARLGRYLGLIGINFAPQDTPEERRRRLMRELPGTERPVKAITNLYTQERYGRLAPDSPDTQRQNDAIDAAWIETRGNILRRWVRKFQFWKRKKNRK